MSLDTLTQCPICDADLTGRIEKCEQWCPDCGGDLDGPRFQSEPEPVFPEMPERKRQKRIDKLNKRQVLAMIDACPDSDTGARNAAMIAACFWGGLRLHELLTIGVHDIQDQKIYVAEAKGNKPRTSRLLKEGVPFVRKWQRKRAKMGLPDTSPLFCSIRKPWAGKQMNPRYFRAFLKDVAADVGIPGRVHPHALRHSHASELTDVGVPINKLSKQLGHSSSHVTAQYIDHVRSKDLDELEGLDFEDKK